MCQHLWWKTLLPAPAAAVASVHVEDLCANSCSAYRTSACCGIRGSSSCSVCCTSAHSDSSTDSSCVACATLSVTLFPSSLPLGFSKCFIMLQRRTYLITTSLLSPSLQTLTSGSHIPLFLVSVWAVECLFVSLSLCTIAFVLHLPSEICCLFFRHHFP